MKSTKPTLLTVILIAFAAMAMAQPCLNGWQYRTAIYLDNSGGSTLNDHQFSVTVNTQDLIVQGKMNASGSDVRVLSKNGTVLPIWIEHTSLNTTTTKIWFKTSIAASTEDTVYLFYGNTGASALSDGSAVFEAFDDFDGSSINGSTWTSCIDGSATVSNSELNLSGNSSERNTLYTSASFDPSAVAEMYVSGFDEGKAMVGIGEFSGTPSGYAMVMDEPSSNIFNAKLEKITSASSCFTRSTLGAPYNTGTTVSTTIGKYGLTWAANGDQTYHYPTGSQNTSSTDVSQPGSAKLFLGIVEENGGNLSVDWVFARKYASNPPSVTTGSETSISISANPSSNSSVCEGSTIVLDADGPSGADYLWTGPGGFVSDQEIATRGNAQQSHAGTYNLTITIPGGCATYTNSLQVDVDAPSDGGNISGATTVCASNNSGQVSISGYTGDVLRWESSSSGQAPWTSINNTSDQLDYLNLQSTTWFRAIVKNGNCNEAASPSAKITVNQTTNVGQMLGSDDICTGTNSGTLNLVNTNDSVISWERSTDQGGSWTTVSNQSYTQTYSNLADTTWYRVSLQNGLCAQAYSDTAILNALPLPSPDFTADTACKGIETTFSNQSTISSGSLSNYSWNFGNGNTSSAENATHIYNAFGSQTVTLTATSNGGCQASTSKSVYVAPNPTAVFNADDECVSDSVSFNNQSFIGAGTIDSYSWDFGDGNNASLEDPSHLYNNAGSYTVSLTATSDLGCSHTVSNQVLIHPDPVADFIRETVFTGESVTYTNTSSITSGNLSYNWNFDNGTITTLANPTTTFSDSGTYQTIMLASSAAGCTDTIRETLILPKAHFSTAEVCFGLATQFSNNSGLSAGALSHHWDFGDGNTSTQTNPSHTYASAGTYTVILTVTSNQNHKSRFDSTITVNPMPAVDFSALSTCDTAAMVFTNNSIISSGSLSYNWTFESGAVSTSTNPNHVFSGSGNFDVKLIATSNEGCVDSTTKQVTVFDRPVADFNYTIMCDGEATPFTDNSTLGSGNISTYVWNFGDGASGSGATPSHQYNTQGVYNTTLTLTSDSGCQSVVTKPVEFYETPPITLTSNSPVCEGSELNLSANTPANSSHDWSGPMAYSDTNQNAARANTQLSHAGSYTLLTTVTGGCVYSNSIDIQIDTMSDGGITAGADRVCVSSNAGAVNVANQQGKIIRWESSLSGQEPWNAINDTLDSTVYNDLQVTTWFRSIAKSGVCPEHASASTRIRVDQETTPGTVLGSADICDGQNSGTLQLVNTTDSILNWEVSTDAGSNWNTINQQSFTLSYYNLTDSSLYRVRLQNGVCADSTSEMAVMDLQPLPQPAFTASEECLNSATSFTNQSAIPTGSISSYDWDFGDGGSATIANPSHTFSSTGNKFVTLTATSDFGCVASIVDTAVVNPNPVPLFQFNDICLEDSVTFTNQSYVPGGSIAQNDWAFGDGNTDTASSPTHGYSSHGTYNVELTVTSTAGCVSDLTQDITIHPMPTAAFAHDTVAEGQSTSFTNNSSIFSGNLFYTWNFGDNSFSNDANPTHTYGSAGEYEVTLLVNSAYGCTDTISDTILVAEIPVADFVVSEECQGDTTEFTNQSTVQVGTLTYQWFFGDGAQSTEENPKHIYQVPGIYNAQLIVTSIYGVTDQTAKTVTVHANPTVDFSFDETCDTIPVEFQNTSFISTGNLNHNWTFGDGETSTEEDPTHLYPSDGNYTVELIVSSDFGCADSTTENLEVHPRPIVDFTFDEVCDGFSTTFQNQSSINSGSIESYLWDFGDGSNSIVENPVHRYNSVGTFGVKLVAESQFGCREEILKPMRVLEVPVVDFEFENVCFGEPVVFRNTSRIENSILSYDWDFADGNVSQSAEPSYSYTSSGSYDVKLIATSDEGCLDSISRSVVVYALPTPMAFSEESEISKGYTTTLYVTGGEFYAWSPTNSLSEPFAASTTARPMQSTQYTVEVLDSNGCAEDTVVTVTVEEDFKVVATNVLTPDNNGKNDRWVIQNVDAYSNTTVIIYDRWGNLVYENKNYQNDWEGTNSAGEPLTDGTYYYVVTFSNSDRTYSGAVTILRNDS